MPLTKSAIKALKQDKRRAISNKRLRSKAKTAMDTVKKTPSQETLAQAFSALDRAAKTHVFHKNKAARLKSALSKLLIKKV